MHAIILAGGFGTRLRAVVTDVPKPLAPVAGRPFLGWLCDELVQQGITGITLSVHHQWEAIRDYVNASPCGVPVSLAVEKTPLGTGGAIAYAMRQSQPGEPVLVLNGDTFMRIDYPAFYRQHVQSGGSMSMVLRHVPDTGRYGRIMVNDGMVDAFLPGIAGQEGFINAGVYILSPDIFDAYGMPEAFSFEQDFMQPYAAELKPTAYFAGDYFIDIGIPEDYARASLELPGIIAKNTHAQNA